MKKKAYILLCIALLFLLTACWGSKDVQDVAYVTAIGFDFQDGKYISYVQVLNFSNIAKGEKTEIGKNIPTWIGRGEGKTITESLSNIYSTSQLRLFWGHVKSIVVSEHFLEQEKRMKNVYDTINRYREIRYKVLFYGTKEPMRNIFSQKSNLNMAPLETLLESPMISYSQRSYIAPEYGYKIFARLDEPPGITTLPSISIEKKSWTEDKKPRPMFRINGAYLFREHKLKGWLSEKNLEGHRWIQRELRRTTINIPNNEDPVAAIVLVKPKPHVQYVIRNGKVFFNIKLSIHAYVDELIYDYSKKDIEEASSQVIEKQIRETYEKGLLIKADVFNLTEHLYRKNPKAWHLMYNKNRFILDKKSLNRIDVSVHLQHSGKYKLRTE